MWRCLDEDVNLEGDGMYTYTHSRITNMCLGQSESQLNMTFSLQAIDLSSGADGCSKPQGL